MNERKRKKERKKERKEKKKERKEGNKKEKMENREMAGSDDLLEKFCIHVVEQASINFIGLENIDSFQTLLHLS